MGKDHASPRRLNKQDGMLFGMHGLATSFPLSVAWEPK